MNDPDSKSSEPSDLADPGGRAKGSIADAASEWEARYLSLVGLSPDAVIIEQKGRIAFVSTSGARLLGSFRPDELVGKPFASLFPPLSREVVAGRLRKMHECGRALPFSEEIILRWDGTELVVEMAATVVPYKGAPASQLIFRDMTLYTKVEELLKNSEALYQSLVENLPQNVFRKDLDGRFTFANERFCRTLGKPLKDVLGKTDYDFYPIPLAAQYLEDDEKLIRIGGTLDKVEEHQPPGKEKRYVHVVKTPLYDSNRQVIGIQGIFRDVTEQKRQEEELARLAYYDGLTGLPNRSLFMERLGQTMKRTRRRKEKGFAVLFLDLDRFKHVNDSLGHGAGDQLLVAFARRVEQLVRPGDTLARLGGDEFTVLVEEVKGSNDVARVAQRILDALSLPFVIDHQEVFATASIGIALGESHRSPEELLRDADIALYRAKERGRGGYEVFDPAMHARAVERLKMETDLRKALSSGEFLLNYQPIALLATQKVIGLEALLRWNHPERGLLLPAQFLPVAEETGLIVPIDLWVLRMACAQMKEWHDRLGSRPPLQIHVNLSTKHFAHSGTAAEIDRILKETGLDPHALTLEITESVVLEEFKEALNVLTGLKGLHVQLFLDDFGAGTFSLKGVHRPPIDSLKIHHSFVSMLEEGSRQADVIRTITTLADNLKMGVIAEGVETREQLAQLRALRCGHVQGYLISKPLTPEAVLPFVTGN